jgi:3'(2'), 5'-bisphosphate nucleotidase
VESDDHQLAARLATETGQLLVDLRAQMFATGRHGWQIMDAGDLAAHRFLIEQFKIHRPDDIVLSEEGADDRRRLGSDRVWIVDPLDGTNEYGEHGRTDWAVHIALVTDGDPVAAAVSLPEHAVTLATEPAPMLPARLDRPIRLVSSRTRANPPSVRIAHSLDAEIWPLGSAGAKTMAVVMGHADIYAHSGGQYEWDNCAPAGVARAAGLHVSRLDGSPLVFNKPDVWSPDLLICRPELAEACLAALWAR